MSALASLGQERQECLEAMQEERQAWEQHKQVLTPPWACQPRPCSPLADDAWSCEVTRCSQGGEAPARAAHPAGGLTAA